MKICVISDLHYKFSPRNSAEIEQNKHALAFLKTLPGEYDRLILNGDIFDLWFDWKYTIIKAYFPVLKVLADIAEMGCRIAYISGNHDFWFNDFLPSQLKIDLYPEAFSLEADDKKICFTHGDSHTSNDARYKFLRAVIRLPITKRLFSWLHPDLALALGKYFSRSSRARRISHNLQQKKMLGLEKYAATLMKDYDYVIMGHTHAPCVVPIGKGIYANSGDWLENNSYITIIDGKLELRTFN
ncbi:MAG TPA: UDP-2,3-diacylglucosamine diphosphatase [Candidatus Cloacimonadota bacterium]|nr:UDP-2,3-diacylglucosamine diphosphatase [Candidatus Cloacimonadota bacterium]HQL15618.1 UDP-2,3-diacylglucosamine diphosphatase [Candidatus Cloacimonadota bacterium]